MVRVAGSKNSACECLRTAHVIASALGVPAADALCEFYKVEWMVRGAHQRARGATSPEVTRWMEWAKLLKGATHEAQSVVKGHM